MRSAGLTPTTPVVPLVESDGDPNSLTSSTALAWGTAPTVPTQFFRQTSFAAAVGAFVIWSFPNGIFIPSGQTLVLWNSATNGVVDVYTTIEEP
jgi:hypothetical protein